MDISFNFYELEELDDVELFYFSSNSSSSSNSELESIDDEDLEILAEIMDLESYEDLLK